MSQGLMRKPQPFTVGTRLSIPKCPDLSTSGHCVAPMDSLPLPLHPRMLRRSPPPPPPPPGGIVQCRSPRTALPDGEESNAGPHRSLARSIRKIALSRHGDSAHKEGAVRMSPRVQHVNAQGNFNNNNSRGLRHLMPDAIAPIAPPCDWIPHKSPVSPAKHSPASSSSDPPRSDRLAPASGGIRRPSAPSDPVQITQLLQEISEAERWVREKLQNLADQHDNCPGQPEQERNTRSIPGDIRSFEGTMMRLNQMSDHLSRNETCGAATIRSQLQSLEDQWQLLKNTAANQSNLVGGANTLQEFNKKADELEIWMREKEEIPPLSLLLDENLDKVQLSRRILDLKQEQLYYSNLQENINSLAQKLEKHGRVESRSTSNRRKQLNRMWLRLQGCLDEYQRSLQLALEGASLWQQADTVLRAMQEKMEVVGCSGHIDQDLRDIAGQIMMLDVSVSQVSSLHPVLASRALHRQRQVKDIWSQLQQTVRTGKSSRGTAFTREPATPDAREQSSVGKQQQQSILGSQTIVSQREPSGRDSSVQIPLHPTPRAGHARCGKLLQCREESDQTKDNCQRWSQSPDAEKEDLLSELKATSQWLQNLEQLLSEPAAMRSPELVRRDLRQVSYLEKQVKSRGVALHSTGRAVRSSSWSADEETQVRVQEVEERLQMVQEALSRRASDLRDTLVLSEFMKVVQLEEERRRRTTALGEPPDPPTDLGDRKEVFTPLEELQEAVEMLNDAAKERERTLAANKETTDLERRLLALSHMIQSACTLVQDVRRKMEEVEQNYVAAKKHVELSDLQEISALHQQVEAEVTGDMQAEARSLEEQRNRLQDLWPERSHVLERNIEEILQAWARLQEDLQKNRAQLHRTSQLREFFLSYLGMISWTEETRAQILSDSPEERLSPAWREGLEKSIDGKMKEFEVLAGIGWKLIGEDRLLTQSIKERLEELQGMLSWVLMRWRCQKHPRIMGNKTQRAREAAEPTPPDNLPHRPLQSDKSEGPIEENATPTAPPPRGPARRRYRRKALSPMLFEQPLRLSGGTDHEEGAELLEDAPRKCASGPLWLEPKVLPTGAGIEEQEEEELLMVSTFLNVKESEGPDPYQSLTVPRPSKKSRSCDQYTLSPDDSKNRTSLLFRSLKRKDKAQRCTVEGIMDLYPDKEPVTDKSTKYEASTWPTKLDSSTPQPDLGNFLNYVKNPLSQEIDAQCAVSGSEKRKVESPNCSKPASQATCPHLTLGSVLVLDLNKETSLTDNIQESLRIVSVGDNGSGHLLESGGTDDLKSQEPREPMEEDNDLHETLSSMQSSCTKSLIAALATSPGYCRQNIHSYGKLGEHSQSEDLEKLNEDFINFQIDRLSPIGVLHQLESEWDGQEVDSTMGETHNVSKYTYPEDNHPSRYQNGVGDISDYDMKSEHSEYNSSYVEFFRTCDPKPNSIREIYSSPYTQPKKTSNTNTATHSFPEVLHPNQEFLEHDDKELEDIWNNAKQGQLENTVHKPQIISLKASEGDQKTKAKQETPNLNVPSSQVVMRSEPNMLVATFTLPTSVVLSKGSLMEKDQEKDGGNLGQEKKVVSTADLTEGNQGDKCQPTSDQEPNVLKNKSEGVETSMNMVTPRKLDYQLMEGSLEKKHIQQSGGRKASSRTWGVFYTVLVRRTLCFYHDRKHSTKSPVCAPPLDLTGALCTPESDYTKRSNCFRLRLRDGSEYLFRAPTSELLHEWVCKLRHNSGIEDTDLLRKSALGVNHSPHLTSRGRPLNSCTANLCKPAAVPGREPTEPWLEPRLEPFSASAGGCRADTHQTKSRVADNIPEFADSEFDLTASRRRSRSFSSVMYQKMSSYSSPQEVAPSYSVTLYIDEPLTPRVRCHSFASSYITNNGSDLKLRNKSVFRKLFWKKE